MRSTATLGPSAMRSPVQRKRNNFASSCPFYESEAATVPVLPKWLLLRVLINLSRRLAHKKDRLNAERDCVLGLGFELEDSLTNERGIFGWVLCDNCHNFNTFESITSYLINWF